MSYVVNTIIMSITVLVPPYILLKNNGQDKRSKPSRIYKPVPSMQNRTL